VNKQTSCYDILSLDYSHVEGVTMRGKKERHCILIGNFFSSVCFLIIGIDIFITGQVIRS